MSSYNTTTFTDLPRDQIHEIAFHLVDRFSKDKHHIQALRCVSSSYRDIYSFSEVCSLDDPSLLTRVFLPDNACYHAALFGAVKVLQHLTSLGYTWDKIPFIMEMFGRISEFWALTNLITVEQKETYNWAIHAPELRTFHFLVPSLQYHTRKQLVALSPYVSNTHSEQQITN